MTPVCVPFPSITPLFYSPQSTAAACSPCFVALGSCPLAPLCPSVKSYPARRPVPSSGKPSWVIQLKVWAPLPACPHLLLSHKPRAQSVGVGHPATGFPITECAPHY